MAVKLSKGRKKSLLKLPISFFDRYLPTVNGDYLRIYLFGLKLCLENQSMPDAEIASALGVLKADVKNAWHFWENEGLINISEDGSLEFENPEELNFSETRKKEQNKPYDAVMFSDVFATIREDEDFKGIVQIVEASYSQLLTQDDVMMLYDVIKVKGSPLELFMITLSHCMKHRKKNMKYIYKVVTENYKDGLTTPEALEQHFTNMEESAKFIKKVAKLVKITGRDLSETEKDYIKKWKNAQKTEEDINQAYEKTIISIGKLSFPYMDKILMNEKGNNLQKKSSVKMGSLNNFHQDMPDFKKITDELIRKQLEE